VDLVRIVTEEREVKGVADALFKHAILVTRLKHNKALKLLKSRCALRVLCVYMYALCSSNCYFGYDTETQQSLQAAEKLSH
jgi:hypothetical protein